MENDKKKVNNDKKKVHNEYMKEYMRKVREGNKGKRSICKICGKEYAKGRTYEHNKTRFHKIADLNQQLQELKKINNTQNL